MGSIQLALTVSSWVLGGVVILAVLGYLIDKTAEPEDRKQMNSGDHR